MFTSNMNKLGPCNQWISFKIGDNQCTARSIDISDQAYSHNTKDISSQFVH